MLKKIVPAICFAVLLFAACHSATYMSGFGDGVGVPDPNKPQAGEAPFLSELVIVSTLNDNNALRFSPQFSSKETMYQADLTSITPGQDYIIKAKSKFEIQYVTGQIFRPAAVTFVIVSAINGPLKNDYIVVFNDPDAETAMLEKLAFSEGDFLPVITTTPLPLMTAAYLVEVPANTKTVIAAGEPVVPSARVIYSASPVQLADKKELVIQVAAPGYNVGIYRVQFVEGDPKPSFLDRLELSSGALEPEFSRDITSYTLTMPAGVPLTVLGHVNQGSVSYSEGSALSLGARYIAAPKKGDVLTLTADYGPGYSPKDYTFNITIAGDDQPFAKLSEIKVDGKTESSSWTLYKRDGGTKSGEGFSEDVLNYELFFTSGLPATVNIEGIAKEPPSTVTYSLSMPLSPPDPNYPLIIKVAKDGYIAQNYQIFINYDDAYKPEATLRDLVLTGGVLTPLFAEYTFNYTTTLLAGANAVLKGEPKQPEFNVSYNPSNAVDNLIADKEIQIVVDGGLAYKTNTYTVVFTPREPQRPYLSEILVDGSPLALTPNNYYYTANIPWDRSSDSIPLSWTAAYPDEVKTMEWALIGSAKMTAGSSCNVTLAAGNNTLVEIRVTCHDGSRAVYYVSLSREGEEDMELRLINILVNDEPLSYFLPENPSYALYVPDDAPRKVKGVLSSDVSGGSVSYSLDSMVWQDEEFSIVLQPGDTKVVTIRAKAPGKFNDYFLTLTRSTALYRVTQLICDTSKGDQIIIKPPRVVDPQPGIMAGQLVTIELKPQAANKIAYPPIVTKLSDNTQIIVRNVVPSTNDPETYDFLMPDSNVKIEAEFIALDSIDNKLIYVSATDNGTKPVMKPFLSSAPSNKIDMVTTKTSISITLRSALKSEIRIGTERGEIWEQGETKTIALKQSSIKSMVIIVCPENTNLGKSYYVLSMVSTPKDGKWEFQDGEHKWAAPADGIYKIEAHGARGGKSETSVSGKAAGGEGGYTWGQYALAGMQAFYITAGSQGGDVLDGGETGGKGGSYNGGDGDKGGFTTTAGGGGGGASVVKEYASPNQFYLIAGGGGGGNTQSNNTDGGKGGGGGGTKTVNNGREQDGNGSNKTGGKGGGYSQGGSKGQGGSGWIKTSGDGLVPTSYGGQVGGNNSKGKVTITWMGVTE